MTNDEALAEFLAECRENLDQLDRDFVALEADPSDGGRLDSVFRTLHSMKGCAGFFGLSRLEALTHGGEGLLCRLRDGSLSLTPEATSALLGVVDRVRAILGTVERAGGEGDEPYEEALSRVLELSGATLARPDAPAFEIWSDPPPPVEPTPAVPRVASQRAPAAAAAEAVKSAAVAVPPAPAPSPRPPHEELAQAAGQVSDTTVRVDVGLLDKLMNLVGELVLARNQIARFGTQSQDAEFQGASQRLSLITTELQENVMKTRMQSIGSVWAKLPRVVRDLAVACGKQVRIEMIGKETELDRTILEAIKDPLTHIVRNAVDHGIEPAHARASRGKPRTGTLTLKAFHEGGQVNIEISDDGAGVNVDAVRAKAIARNLVSAERAARLSTHELTQLIFQPGFSTAAQVTNVSGRGVGMDVVKTNVEKIGGTVDAVSVAGAGTTLKIKIPLTLAIVPALVIAGGGQRYAIPQVNLLELVRLEGEAGRAAIERVYGAPVYRLRDRLLPLVFLNDLLGGEARGAGAEHGEGFAVNVVVVQADDRRFGLVVDEVHDTEEIVVKPLGKELRGLTIYQGATIMGDGRVALILDIVGLANHAGAAVASEAAALDVDGGLAGGFDGETRRALLLFGVGRGDVMALPLAMVTRIEEFPRASIERAGGHRVVQYRGEILPLIDVSAALGVASPDEGEVAQVIVYSENERCVGFLVGRILDVIEDDGRIARSTARPGVSGATVVEGRVTEVLDVEGVIVRHYPGFFAGRAA